MSDLVIRWGNLEKYFAELEEVGAQAADIETYARDQVFNKSGFDYHLCVLEPLADMMDSLGDVFGDLRTTFDSRWESLSAALALAAQEVERVDTSHSTDYLKAYTDLVDVAR